MNVKHILVSSALILLLSACSEGSGSGKEQDEAQKRVSDSLSRLRQKEYADSLKKLNPLLILPPDSNYSGEYVDKYPNGIVKYRGTFRFGERHGQWMSFYPSGLLWSELHFDKGLRHGPNLTYYENGKLRYSGFYKNDLVDSTWVYYDSTGRIVETLVYRNNRIERRMPATQK
ncbi:MAG TPA: hypothetical protein PLQ93_02480 [Bacteroidia bacterium]|nr:hypothetical protein [Bacteroidia bacterium]